MHTSMKSDEIILGSTVKLNVYLEPIGGLHMENYDFTCYVYTPEGNTVTVNKKGAIKVNADNYMIVFDSLKIGEGKLFNKVVADIPDTDCPNSIRKEVLIMNCNCKIVCPNGMSRW